MDYKTVFEATEKSFEVFSLIPVIFVLVGLIIAINVIRNKPKSDPKRKKTIIIGFIISGFALLLSLVTVPPALNAKKEAQRILDNKEYKVIEGEIENFDPMPYDGHAEESFTVNGVYFEYSDYRSSLGYNNAASHGGVIKANGQEVRLSYVEIDNKNQILKIEVKL